MIEIVVSTESDIACVLAVRDVFMLALGFFHLLRVNEIVAAKLLYFKIIIIIIIPLNSYNQTSPDDLGINLPNTYT